MGIKGRNLCFFHLGFEAPLGFGKVEVVVFDQVFFFLGEECGIGKVKVWSFEGFISYGNFWGLLIWIPNGSLRI